MIASQISKVLRYALNAFPSPTGIKYSPEVFEERLNTLKVCLDKTTAADIDFHNKYTSKEFWEKEEQAPVGYIDIYEDDNITLGVFILKPGMRMPLHDHPHMHGLLKVITGQVCIHSYTVVDEEDYVLSSETLPILTITAHKNPVLTANAQSNSVLLHPKLGNLHEIICDKESAAAFIDVLSPPYDTLIRVDNQAAANLEDTSTTYLPRKCRYFEITEQLKEDCVKLKTCKSPEWFWTSREEYMGPKVLDGPSAVARNDPSQSAKAGDGVVPEKKTPYVGESESGDAVVTNRMSNDQL